MGERPDQAFAFICIFRFFSGEGGKMADKYIEEIFRQKYEKYSQLIFKIAFLHMGSTCDAEDVMQNVFINCFIIPPISRTTSMKKPG